MRQYTQKEFIRIVEKNGFQTNTVLADCRLIPLVLRGGKDSATEKGDRLSVHPDSFHHSHVHRLPLSTVESVNSLGCFDDTKDTRIVGSSTGSGLFRTASIELSSTSMKDVKRASSALPNPNNSIFSFTNVVDLGSMT